MSTKLDIAALESALRKAAAYMAAVAKREDTVIFVGTTKSGKSTLINFLMGNKLIGKRFRHKIHIEKAQNYHGPQIGVTATSETVIPSRYISQKFLGCALWDAPGFDDNRGYSQDICNSFYTSELFKNIKSAKIILVADIATLLDDSTNALRILLRAVENLLTHKFVDSFSGIAMVITKVDMICGRPVTKEDITDLLRILITDSIDISDYGKDFVRHLVCHSQSIGFFKQATEGPITDDIADGIMEAINGLQAIPNEILKEILPSISESAKVSLFEVHRQLMSMQTFYDLQDIVPRVLRRKLDEIESRRDDDLSTDELFDFLLELATIKDRMVKVMDDSVALDKKIDALKMMDSEIARHINECKLDEKAKYVFFVDTLLNTGESRNFNICIQNVLLQSTQKVEELMTWTRCRISEINKGITQAEIAKVQENCNNDLKKLEKEIEELKTKIDELNSKRCTIS